MKSNNIYLFAIISLVLGVGSGYLFKNIAIDKTEQGSIRDLMSKRINVRTFDSSVKIPKEKLDLIIEAGLYSPSQNFRYPYRLRVLTDTKNSMKRKKELWSKVFVSKGHCSENGKPIVEYSNSIRTASVNIELIADNTLAPLEDYTGDRDVSSFKQDRDIMIPITAMMIQAEQLGFDTSFTGVFESAASSLDLFKGKGIEKDIKDRYTVGVLSIGIAAKNRAADSSARFAFRCNGKFKFHKNYSWIKPDGEEEGIILSRNLKGDTFNRAKNIVFY